MSLLRVTVQRATNLPDVDLRGKSDPYVKLLFQGKQRRSSLNLKAAKQVAGSLALSTRIRAETLNSNPSEIKSG